MTEIHLADDSLSEPVPQSPLELLSHWLHEAKKNSKLANPDAFHLATADAQGRPSGRVLLCRGLDCTEGYLSFYSNRNSRKGVELAGNPRAAGTFFWDEWSRQVRVEGHVLQAPESQSDSYFANRGRLSQISAWASQQSQPIPSREAFLEYLDEVKRKYDQKLDLPIPRPPHWGGYRLYFDRVELWVGAEGRAHDRVQWNRELRVDAEKGCRMGEWTWCRLQP